jgi:glycosyltransferase 2 family protein
MHPTGADHGSRRGQTASDSRLERAVNDSGEAEGDPMSVGAEQGRAGGSVAADSALDLPRAPHRRIPWTWLRLPVSLGLLAFILGQIDLGAAMATVLGVSLPLLFVVLVLLAVDRVLSAYRWYMLLPHAHGEIGLWRLLRLVLVSTFIGYFMPGTVGIDAVRIYGLSRMAGDLPQAVSSVLLERVLALLALVALVLGGLAVAPTGLPDSIGQTAWLGLACLVLGGWMLMDPRMRRLTRALLAPKALDGVRRRLGEVYAALDVYRGRPGLMLWALVVALAFQLLRVLIVYTAAQALGAPTALVHFVAIVPIIFFVTLLPISVAGIGVQEAAFVYLFGFVGMPAETALPLSLVMHGAAFVSVLPGGLFYWRRGLSQ